MVLIIRGLMVFRDRLKEKRLAAGMTQAELAEKVGVSARTIQNYEMGTRKPRNLEVIQKIAEALRTTPDYLLGSSGAYVVAAQEKGGAKAARDIEALVSEVTGLFAGGMLSEESMDGAIKALNDAYWIAKEKNRKYTPKKYRPDEQE
jgi:transcriptional regulator with XRE-family HTH domain